MFVNRDDARFLSLYCLPLLLLLREWGMTGDNNCFNSREEADADEDEVEKEEFFVLFFDVLMSFFEEEFFIGFPIFESVEDAFVPLFLEDDDEEDEDDDDEEDVGMACGDPDCPRGLLRFCSTCDIICK